MRGYLCRFNTEQSRVHDGLRTSLPLSGCPALYSYFAAKFGVVVPIDDAFGVPWALSAQGYTYVAPGPKDSTPASVMEKRVFPSLSGENQHHRKRMRSGEVLVSERQVGSVLLSASGAFRTKAPIYVMARNTYFTSDMPGGKSSYLMANGNYADHFDSYYDLCPLDGVVAPPLDVASSLFSMNNGWAVPDERFDLPPDAGSVTKALADANAKQWDLLTEVAELPEALMFVKDSLMKIRDVTDDYDRRRYSFVRAVGDDVALLASLWLSYRYAIMPIVYSIQDALAVFRDVPQRYAEYKVRADVAIPAPLVTGYVETSSVSVQTRAFIKRRYSPMDFLGELLRKVQFNTLATAWELTPRSFIIDWAFNISDLIVSVTGDSSCMQEAATWSSRTDGAWSYTSVTDGSSFSATFDYYHRYPIQPIAHVGLDVGNHMTWRRVIDAVALSYIPLRKLLRSLK